MQHHVSQLFGLNATEMKWKQQILGGTEMNMFVIRIKIIAQ